MCGEWELKSTTRDAFKGRDQKFNRVPATPAQLKSSPAACPWPPIVAQTTHYHEQLDLYQLILIKQGKQKT